MNKSGPLTFKEFLLKEGLYGLIFITHLKNPYQSPFFMVFKVFGQKRVTFQGFQGSPSQFQGSQGFQGFQGPVYTLWQDNEEYILHRVSIIEILYGGAGQPPSVPPLDVGTHWGASPPLQQARSGRRGDQPVTEGASLQWSDF